MARRPDRVLRFAWNPPVGGAVEPPEAEAETGWSTGKRPAAQYVNALFNNIGQTLDFLRGPSLSRWSRVALGASLLDSDSDGTLDASIAADRDTVDGYAVLRRLVVAGEDASGLCVYVSRRGDTWTRYDNFPAGPTGKIARVYCFGGHWWLLFDDGGADGWLLVSTVDGVSGNALDGSNDWVLAQAFTGSGGVDRGCVAMAYAPLPTTPDGGVHVVAVREALYADGGGGGLTGGLGGASAVTVTGDAPGASGRGAYTDLVFDGTYYLAVSDYGDVIQAAPSNANVGTTVGRVTTDTGKAWRLSVGDGEVIAWERNVADPSGTVFYRSTDHGATWSTVGRVSAGPYGYLTDLVWLDGEWVATSYEAPYLWSSNDLVTWTRGRLPYIESDAQALWGLTYSEGAWVVLREATVLLGARAEDLAAGVWSPDPTPTILGNAGYIRGRKVDATAPTDGQGLAYEASSGLLVWTTPSAGVSLSSSTPAALGVAAAGAGTDAARGDHVHAMPSAADVGATTYRSGTLVQRAAATGLVAGDLWYVTSGAGTGDVYVWSGSAWQLLRYDRTPAASGAVARWLLADSTSTIVDSVGAYDLAYSGSSALQQRPSPWGACEFTGGLAAGAGPKGATALEPATLSLLAWVNAYAYSGGAGQFLIGKRQDDATWSVSSPTNMAALLYVSGAGVPSAYVIGASGTSQAVPATTEWRAALNAWVRVVMTYSTASGTRVYVNGRLAASAAAQGAIQYASHGSWTIGVNNSGSGVSTAQYFDGFLRDLQVVDGEMTAAQVLEDYARGVGTYAGQ